MILSIYQLWQLEWVYTGISNFLNILLLFLPMLGQKRRLFSYSVHFVHFVVSFFNPNIFIYSDAAVSMKKQLYVAKSHCQIIGQIWMLSVHKER